MRITISGENTAPKTFDLDKIPEIIIGREPGTTGFVTPAKYESISRNHLVISRNAKSGELFIKDISANGTTTTENVSLPSNVEIPFTQAELILVLPGNYKLSISNEAGSKNQADQNGKHSTIRESLKLKKAITIGRAPECEIILDEPMISRKHALIEAADGRYYITDLGSMNGTFVDGKKITSRTEISSASIIHIGPVEYKLDSTENKSEKTIQATGISRLFSVNDKNGNVQKKGLNTISLKIRKGEFIALMGPSGCGKSTLLKLLTRYENTDSGVINVFGEDISKPINFDRLKHAIGYAQQNDNWLIPDLTVKQTLDYSARLRLPDTIIQGEIDERIDEVFGDLNLNKEIFSKKISELSGGQQKRIAIAVELLSQPQILFLDEPTSPLDPETIDSFLKCIKKLAEKRAVVMVTHKPDDLFYVDRVVFLGTGGYHVFDGKPEELLQKFGKSNILEVYKHFNNPAVAKAEWEKTYGQSVMPPSNSPFGLQPSGQTKNGITQFYWLSKRYFTAKMGSGLGILIGISLFLPAVAFGTITNFMITVPFMMVILTVFLGLFNAIEEVLYDRPTFEREQKVNVRVLPYYFSKLVVLSAFGIFQVLFICAIAFGKFKYMSTDPVHLHSELKVYAWLLLLSISAIILGLLISTLSKKLNHAVYLLLFILVLQMMFGGTFAKLDSNRKEVSSYFTLSRWGMQGLSHLLEKDTLAGKVLTYSQPLKATVDTGTVTIETDTIIKDSKTGMMVPTHITFLRDSTRITIQPNFDRDTMVAIAPIKALGFYDRNIHSAKDSTVSTNHIEGSDKLLHPKMRSGKGAALAICLLDLLFMILAIAELSSQAITGFFSRIFSIFKK